MEGRLKGSGRSFADANRSLERGIAILRAFRPGVTELGNAEIVERTGLAKATVSRLMQTLVGAGMLERSPTGRLYRLAPAVLSLAHAMRLGSSILPVIAPLMRQEATRRRVNVGLASADDDMMVYLESFRYSARSSFRTVVSGQRVPIELTSLGRAYLWGLPAIKRSVELNRIAERRARQWPQLREEIQASLDELDRDGYCTVSWQPGVVAVATTIILPRQRPHALNISISNDEPVAAMGRLLGPWLLDLQRRCQDLLQEEALALS